MFCTNCGAKLPDDAQSCTECGVKFDAKNELQPTPQQQYQVPPNQTDAAFVNDYRAKPLTTGDIFIMWLLSIIPVVSIIMPFVWAFSSTENYNRRAIGRFMLIMYLIAVILSIVLMIIFVIIGISFADVISEAFAGI